MNTSSTNSTNWKMWGAVGIGTSSVVYLLYRYLRSQKNSNNNYDPYDQYADHTQDDLCSAHHKRDCFGDPDNSDDDLADCLYRHHNNKDPDFPIPSNDEKDNQSVDEHEKDNDRVIKKINYTSELQTELWKTGYRIDLNKDKSPPQQSDSLDSPSLSDIDDSAEEYIEERYGTGKMNEAPTNYSAFL